MTATHCQSCGMPLTEEVLGTEATGAKSPDYCHFCYENGAFKQPEMTMEQMIELCVPFMVEGGMAKEQATQIMQQSLPRLLRWQAR